MTQEYLQSFCLNLKGTTQDIKWKKDLCFLIGDKMYSVQGLIEPYGVSFKTTPEEYLGLIERDGILPAPYMARYHWVLVEDLNALTKSEWEYFIDQSYRMVYQKLPKIKKEEIGPIEP